MRRKTPVGVVMWLIITLTNSLLSLMITTMLKRRLVRKSTMMSQTIRMMSRQGNTT